MKGRTGYQALLTVLVLMSPMMTSCGAIEQEPPPPSVPEYLPFAAAACGAWVAEMQQDSPNPIIDPLGTLQGCQRLLDETADYSGWPTKKNAEGIAVSIAHRMELDSVAAEKLSNRILQQRSNITQK